MKKNNLQFKKSWMLNTSNKGKLHEFKQLFAEYDIAITSTEIDLKEISADPLTVVVHKASQMGEEILVEDTSLDIEGTEVGINVRWLFDQLTTFVNRKACLRVLLAYRKNDLVYVYEAKIDGTIVLPRGNGGFGFDSVFLPCGSNQTLAEAKPHAVNVRAKVVEAFIKNQPSSVTAPITQWRGSWQ